MPNTPAFDISSSVLDTAKTINLPLYDFAQGADFKKADLHAMVSRFHDNRSPDFYKKLQDCYEGAKCSLDNVKADDPLKIPQTIHTLWVNDTGDEWQKEYAELFIHTMKVNLESKHVLWVKSKDHSIAKNPLLDLDKDLQSLIDVREISSLSLPLQSKDHPIWDPMRLIEQGLYSVASQVLRYEILAQLGGVYRSTDCQIIKPLKPLNQALNFYTGMDSNFMQYSRDFLIGSSPNHPIVLEYLEQLLQDTNPKDYLKGHIRLSYAFDTKARTNGNQDVVMPHQMFSPLKGDTQVRSAFDTNINLHEGSFAVHFFDRSWVGQNKESKQDNLCNSYATLDTVFDRIIGLGYHCQTKAQINAYFLSPWWSTKKGHGDLFDWLYINDYSHLSAALSNKLEDFFERQDFEIKWNAGRWTGIGNKKYNMIWNHVFDEWKEDHTKLEGILNEEKLDTLFPLIKNKINYLKDKFISAKQNKTLYVISHPEKGPDLENLIKVRNALTTIRNGDKQFALLFVPNVQTYEGTKNIMIREAKNLKPGWEGGDHTRWKKILDEFKFTPTIWE